MKITKETLREMIEAEMDKKSFGADTTSASDASRELKQRSKDAIQQKGIDNKERGIIGRMEKNLAKLADLTDIKSGSVFAVLKKLNAIIEDQIAKLEGSNQDEE